MVENMLSNVKASEIAIPEIQRPFVWDSTKVRDLMDSLNQGCPKLRKCFSIPTPVGNYNPDWIISFKEGSVKHIYFVAKNQRFYVQHGTP